MTDPVLIEVTRGALVESRHRGAIVVVDPHGRRRAAVGDVGQAVFPRSAVKAIQALPLVESGAADRYGFGNAELALACSSHNGEPRHVTVASRMLAAAGRSVADLECGPQVPSYRAAADDLVRAGVEPSAIHNNCSGKHAGFVCTACHLGEDPRGYVTPAHPVQREIAATLAALTGTALDAHNRAIDGCSIPTYAIPLDALALAFARLVTGEGMAPGRATACRRLVDACFAEPFMVAGTDRFCTDTMTRFGRRVFVKTGAEGVFCAAFPETGFGVALKCDDGAGRASETAMAAIIDAFLPMSEAERAAYADRLHPPILSRVGARVGEVRPVAELVASLRDGRPVN
jgi:L-asparaginase II